LITPQEITKKAGNKIPEVLAAWLEGREIFPLVIRSDKQLTASTFDALNKELSVLLKSSKDAKGFGYRVELKEVNTRKLGKQKLPEAIVFDEPNDYWKYIDREKEWIAFQEDVVIIRKRLPQLEEWLKINTSRVISNSGKWPDLLKVCQWFINNPYPNCYLREIPAQPHTKFIEENKPVIDQLLTRLIEPSMKVDGRTFEERFNLKVYERFVQIRLLDINSAALFNGIAHLGITLSDLSKLNLSCKKVFVLENKSNYSNIENFMTLPHMKDAIAIFGSGFSVGGLKSIGWLSEKEIYYWGDIDTHGFLILNRLRKYFPHVQTFLMDKNLLMKYNDNWSEGAETTQESLAHLTTDELDLFLYLKENNARLEQEKIRQEDVLVAIDKLFR
jgi:hypothetical protein